MRLFRPDAGGAARRRLPTAAQELLLQAAFRPGPEALAAWTAWCGSQPPEGLDPGSQRLLPQVYANLRGLGEGDSRLAALRRAYQLTRARNAVVLRDLAALLRAFRAEGIETLVLKGAALIALAYGDPGRRPLTDVDVLVPAARALDAISVLQRAGWASALAAPETLVGVRHADDFVDARGRRVDLHWAVLQECCEPGASDDFWRASVPLELEGAATRALCPADQLLHVCVHGARSSSVQPLGWAADAMAVLCAGGDPVAWDRLVAQTQARRLVVPMREALAYLRERLDADVPGDVSRALASAPVTRLELLEHRVKASRRPLVGSLPVLWLDHRRLAAGDPRARGPLGFPRYLQRTFRSRSLATLPLSLAVLTARRVGRALPRFARAGPGRA